jgi:hypothetical protein
MTPIQFHDPDFYETLTKDLQIGVDFLLLISSLSTSRCPVRPFVSVSNFITSPPTEFRFNEALESDLDFQQMIEEWN